MNVFIHQNLRYLLPKFLHIVEGGICHVMNISKKVLISLVILLVVTLGVMTYMICELERETERFPKIIEGHQLENQALMEENLTLGIAKRSLYEEKRALEDLLEAPSEQIRELIATNELLRNEIHDLQARNNNFEILVHEYQNSLQELQELERTYLELVARYQELTFDY